MHSFELYRFVKNSREYKINGNVHTLEQIQARNITSDKVKRMVALSIEKMEIQKTYAVISGNDKLLILRINSRLYFVITCLVADMRVKRDTMKIYV